MKTFLSNEKHFLVVAAEMANGGSLTSYMLYSDSSLLRNKSKGQFDTTNTSPFGFTYKDLHIGSKSLRNIFSPVFEIHFFSSHPLSSPSDSSHPDFYLTFAIEGYGEGQKELNSHQ